MMWFLCSSIPVKAEVSHYCCELTVKAHGNERQKSRVKFLLQLKRIAPYKGQSPYIYQRFPLQ